MKKEKNSHSKESSKENKLNHIERKILRLLYQAKAPMNAYEIASETGISFPTVQKYIETLAEKKLIIPQKE